MHADPFCFVCFGSFCFGTIDSLVESVFFLLVASSLGWGLPPFPFPCASSISLAGITTQEHTKRTHKSVLGGTPFLESSLPCPWRGYFACMALCASSEYIKLGLCMFADPFCRCMSFFLCFGALVLLSAKTQEHTHIGVLGGIRFL
jgi:hypothetical protein